ncbi:tRNA uridine-5-carboxymethylaminomethyl(34) synthesis GTPase MnmE [Fibrobacter sp.]|uniref:tRNA uridine-5-carboxymethylaminomethyl(34) synthesis GTPase MnmE n=1 Tax=Fibrobacter sp. TaxID=35828 RepID=UPI0025B817E6|nr:tRNA uridine-5-carboxymethylaminomethyl(34) synthesis GTPase MnmE [Fibrobacter sp.]MBR2058372.1 tRNA uridine-5-carboxymethylaminomethyl(34) synthesis GTPase MnmE [Fibrobacter sp.]MBR4007298.1 tRNA uridine-5-carboxymethylaminomethyl(34) synthesis GTPase MnmE [Fibrobacter sp.]
MDSQTIVAPMTPSGVSAVAALRVSGAHVRDVVARLFGNERLENLKAREACLGTARDPQSGKLIDSLLYIFFEGPNSYTGEDVLELYPHGNPLIVRDLLQAIRGLDGVRLAEPGEFTRRAFLNGKMDLTQAESVADVIHSANRAELENAHRLLGGALSKKIAALASQVKDISARLELDVDFAEEEADPDFAGWEARFVAVRESIQQILNSFHGKASLSRLPLAVLYGAPNAGKSSLVNALLGEDRVLVSNVPGTTRDFVEVRLFLAGGEIRLVDTAGIAAQATDELDALSQKKSREILEEADMKILVLDGASRKCRSREGELASRHSREGENLRTSTFADMTNNADLVVYSKSDLRASPDRNGASPIPDGGLSVSSKTGEGLDALRQAMNASLFKQSADAEDLWITSEREKACLEDALAGIDRALDLLRNNPAVELLAFEMQVVRRALQSITGEISSEDILQSIFAGFCIGK